MVEFAASMVDKLAGVTYDYKRQRVEAVAVIHLLVTEGE